MATICTSRSRSMLTNALSKSLVVFPSECSSFRLGQVHGRMLPNDCCEVSHAKLLVARQTRRECVLAKKEVRGTRGLATLSIPLTACWLLLAGCWPFPAEPPGRDQTIVGVITEVDVGRTPMRILIEENPGVWNGPEVAGEKIYFEVTGGTDVFVLKADGSWRRGSEEDLKVGASAKAWHTGGVRESYPGQAVAGEIAITKPTGQ